MGASVGGLFSAKEGGSLGPVQVQRELFLKEGIPVRKSASFRRAYTFQKCYPFLSEDTLFLGNPLRLPGKSPQRGGGKKKVQQRDTPLPSERKVQQGYTLPKKKCGGRIIRNYGRFYSDNLKEK